MVESQQKRFKDEYHFVNYIMKAVVDANTRIPPPASNSQQRDKALLAFSRSEPLISGVISSAVSRDKNRSWSLVGGSRQVAKYARYLHGLNDGKGWRHFVSTMAHSWYVTNFGFTAEIGFEFKNSPPVTMWTLDPTKCEFKNGQIVYGGRFNNIEFEKDEFIQGNSMPSFVEEMNGVGQCALDRALDFTRLLIGIVGHQLEKLGVAPPKGILHGTGITNQEWSNALAQAEIDKENKGEYYDGVLTLFTQNTDASIKLIGLSELPDNFSLKTFVDIMMQGYALCFGYPVGEFWAIESGSFGRAGEMEVQVKQATAKGELDFALSFQEQLQTKFLPSSLSFEFDQRNDSGENVEIEGNFKQAEMISMLYESGLSTGEPLLSKEQALYLLAEKGIIPKDWTDADEDVVADDLQKIRSTIFSNNDAVKYLKDTNEQIVVYNYNPKNPKYFFKDLGLNGFPKVGSVTQIYDNKDIFGKRVF